MSSNQSPRPPGWLKSMNRLVMLISRLGANFSDEKTMVLTVPGRKTGAPRSTPVDPITIDGKRYVVGGFPKADWVQNVRAAGEATLRRGRRHEHVRMVELPADQAGPILRMWPTEVPASVGLMKQAGLVSSDRPEEFEALAGVCTVFRIDPTAQR
jgi:deazaflavin-dependent oxidoreductase (nitroreductase family)